MPFNAVALRGIPITGTVVKLATTPGRCAAAPAPAIKAIAPSASRRSTKDLTASGVRCAEAITIS